MDREEFIKIMNDDEIGGSKISEPGCNALKGLLLITKYIPNEGIGGAGHDVIYSADIDTLIDAGITKEDVIELRCQNWMVRDGQYLACFV